MKKKKEKENVRASAITGATACSDQRAWPSGTQAEWAMGQLLSAMGRHYAGGLGPFKTFPITKQI
jgi:hypothetical protein